MRRRLAWLTVALLAAGSPVLARAATAGPALALRPDCGPVAGAAGPTYTIEVIGRGLTPNDDVTI
ncbi:MAG TPA: hypothetical protein VOB72_24990, partial [Candidatus Dormibacteraeota bacterium]|nr:hypothetical protein [Candidatus Dormibacteraeota bacterium]